MTSTATTADPATVLDDAAFGATPSQWPLPTARTPEEHWLRAVAAGGQGRYGVALTDLAMLHGEPDGPLKSLAYSTRASFLRQLGWHDKARGWDGRALTLAGTDPRARADAMVGLAADALGVGRFAASARLLDCAGEAVAEAPAGRLSVRMAWVCAELAMFQGEGPAAVEHAERAVAAAAALGSARHAVKSDVVLAAALCSAGALDRARAVADAALQATDRLGIIPLRWALASLLADIGSAHHTPAEVASVRADCADTVRRRGGVWSGR